MNVERVWPAYQLSVTVDHLVDMTYDAALIPFPGSDTTFFYSKGELRIPLPLRFVANFSAIRGRDYPVTRPPDVDIMSKRMLDVLRSVGPFEHRVHPVVLIDDTVDPAKRYAPDGSLRRDIIDESFVFVQLLSHTDAFDWERSVYTRDDLLPGRVLEIDKFVLRDVPLPPLFRLSARPGCLYVSAAAKDAIERAGLRGPDFPPYWMGWGRPDAR